MGDIGIIGCDGRLALDTPLEDGRDKLGEGDEEIVIRFAVSVLPWADWSVLGPNCPRY